MNDIAYKINSIDKIGTVNFSFTDLNGTQHTVGENFGHFVDIIKTAEDGAEEIVKTAGQQLHEAIQAHIQQFVKPELPQSIKDLLNE